MSQDNRNERSSSDRDFSNLRIRLQEERQSLILLVTGLYGDENFEPTDNCYFRTADSQRWEVNRVIKEEAMKVGYGFRVSNTEKYPGTTGWSFYDSNRETVATIARNLAARYGIEAEIHLQSPDRKE